MGLGIQSHLSPHVHYGQISVVYVAHRALAVARARPELRRGVDKYIDELVIRRELAINFALNNPKYDQYEGVPVWARRTLAEHSVGLALFTHVILQSKHGSIDDSQVVHVTNRTPGSGNPSTRATRGRSCTPWSSSKPAPRTAGLNKLNPVVTHSLKPPGFNP
jgi:hypothetical protein